MTESWRQWEGYVLNGEYPLQRYLGGSDHSAVFLTQRRAGEPRRAAIKFIPADLNDSESQILRWKLAMKLPHPRLLRIFDAGHCELAGVGFLFVVTECAEEDLSQIIPHRALTIPEIREVLNALVQVLAYLHGKGFALGQIRPTNVLAVGDQVKVAGDSICALTERRSARAGSVYDPPEAASGTVSAAGDLWALGALLIEALTQHPLVRDGSRQPVVPKDMPEPFREIARQCLKLDPEGRWSTAQIAARLDLGLPQPKATPLKTATPQPKTAPIAAAAASSRKKFAGWSYVVPIGVAALALIMVAGSRMHGPATQSAVVSPSEMPSQSDSEAASERQSGPPTSRPGAARATSTPAPELQSPAVAASDTHAELKPTASVSRTRIVPADAGRGEILHQVVPEVPRGARDTIQGKVRVSVRVSVDSSGNVVQTALASAGPSKYFARLAEQAARDWKFAPATASGEPVPNEWLLRFSFGRAGTEVNPGPVSR